MEGGVLLEPMITDARQWFEELDRLSAGSFMAKRRHRHHPPTPKRVIFE